jgi:AI-2 transport protein TqsA
LEQRIQTVCLLLLTSIGVAGAMYWLRPVMIPFVLALFISFALSSFVSLLVRRLRVPRVVALIATLLLSLLFFLLIGALVSMSVAQLAASAASYQEQFRTLVSELTELLARYLPNVDQELVAEPFSRIPMGSVGSVLAQTSSAIADILSKSALVLIFVLFLVIGGSGAAPTGTWAVIESKINRYVVAKSAISGATGVLVGLVLWLLGVPLALVFGLMAFLLNFIPSIGSIVATLLPLPVVLTSAEISAPVAVLAIAVPGAVQILLGNFIEPKILGESLDLHPVTVLLALIFWGTLWGIVGMLLATPMTAIARILFEKLEPTRTLAEVMAGRLDALRPAP